MKTFYLALLSRMLVLLSPVSCELSIEDFSGEYLNCSNIIAEKASRIYFGDQPAFPFRTSHTAPNFVLTVHRVILTNIPTNQSIYLSRMEF